ncbi:hypothetical protein ACFY1B_34905 [Streptomyces mirabilis]|uniref:hypothetical protein n=1 Tax=Streptomyces mirabilis TaxID=68239 RepID=UPI0036A7DD38
MKVVPTASAGTGGGMVNVARGLGTAVGVAAVTLALHLAPTAAVLLAAAVLAIAATRSSDRPTRPEICPWTTPGRAQPLPTSRTSSSPRRPAASAGRRAPTTRESLHHHGPATADVHLTRPLIERLRPESALIRLHPGGGRVTVVLDGSQTALDLLLSLALSANRLVNITNLAWRAPCTLQAAEDRAKAPARS